MSSDDELATQAGAAQEGTDDDALDDTGVESGEPSHDSSEEATEPSRDSSEEATDYEKFLEFEQARRRESGLPPLAVDEASLSNDETGDDFGDFAASASAAGSELHVELDEASHPVHDVPSAPHSPRRNGADVDDEHDPLLSDVLSQLTEDTAPDANALAEFDDAGDDRDSVLPQSLVAAALSERPPPPASQTSGGESSDDQALDTDAAVSGLLLGDEGDHPESSMKVLSAASPLSDLRRARDRKNAARAAIAGAAIAAGGVLAVWAGHRDGPSESVPRSVDSASLPAPVAETEATAHASSATPAGQGAHDDSRGAQEVQQAEPVGEPPEEGSLSALVRLEKSADAQECNIPEGTAPGGVDASARALRNGRAAIARGAPEDARVSLCNAAHHNPRNFMASAALVQTYLLLGDAEAAVEVASRAAQKHPKNRMIGELYGDALARKGDVDAAVEQWMVALRLKPKARGQLPAVAQSYVQAAKQTLRASDVEQTKRLLRRAAFMDPDSVAASEGLARLLSSQDETRAAIGWAERAVKLAPQSAGAQVTLGDVLRAAGSEDAAKNAYRKALELDPNHREAKSKLAAR